jgi:urea transport system permease protein
MRMAGRTHGRLWTLVWCVGVSLGASGAGGASLDATATAVAAADQQRQALEHIRALADPAYKDLLVALKEGALYTWRGKLLILDDSGAFNDLAGQPLLDASGHPLIPDDAEQVPLEEANAPLLQRALDVISLGDLDPRVRKAAALKLGNLHEPAVVGLVEQALARERDPDVKPVMLEALNKLRLFAPDPQVRRQTAEYLAATRAESALALLKRRSAEEPDAAARQAMRHAIASIEGYLRLRNVLGYVFNGFSLAS